MKIGRRNGFTLVELLVVIAIIAILSALTLPLFARHARGKFLTTEKRTLTFSVVVGTNSVADQAKELGFGDGLVKAYEMTGDTTNKSSAVSLVIHEDCKVLTGSYDSCYRMATIRELFALHAELSRVLDGVTIVALGSDFSTVRNDERSQRLYPIVCINKHESSFTLGAYQNWPDRTLFVIAHK